jgi:hypothetical protein
MKRRVHGCARTLFLAAFALAVIIPAVALAQVQECKIEIFPNKGCGATFCGPDAPRGEKYEYRWSGPEFAGASSQCVTVKVPGGYLLQVLDSRGVLLYQCKAELRSCFNSPPDCSKARAKDPVLWPPNHKLVPIEIEGVTDPDGDPVVIVVGSVSQDEPLDVEGDGSTCADAEIVDGQASVRAERIGTPEIPGNGRVYTLTFVASDKQGGQCKGQVRVCVPHDMGQGDSCIDDGQIYSSFGPCQ